MQDTVEVVEAPPLADPDAREGIVGVKRQISCVSRATSIAGST
jgi:hypothetical protein